MTDDLSEFSFLPAQADALGVPLPAAQRLTVSLDDGRALSAVRFGSEPPVVTFLHGAGLNAHTWDSTILALGLPALAVDLPGHGDSSWRNDLDYSGRTLAADIAPALSAWTLTPQIIVGQSLGGLTAAALAAAHPNLVDEIIVIDITPGIDTTGPAALREFFAGPTDFASRDELVDRAMAFGLGGDRDATWRGVFLNTRVRDDGRIEWKHHMAHLAASLFADPDAANAAAVSAAATAPILRQNGWEDLAAVRVPLTLVRALRGFVSEEAAAEFARRLPHARVATVDAPHNAQETAAAALAELIREALPDPVEP